MRLLACVLLLLVLAPGAGAADDLLPVVRVAALKFGTVNWELDVITRHKLDEKYGFRLETVQLISPGASAVSLQAGASDVIVSDWLWVARQSSNGRSFRYYPYSTAVGELLVPPDSPATKLADLSGQSLGVAGGAQDKTWLLFRAFTQEQGGYDLADRVDERFAAPPLLNGLAETGQLDAILTYWHYGAALKAQGYRSLLTLEVALATLRVTRPVPMLGWVFPDAWAQAHPTRVNAFLAASYEAKSLLRDSDEEWHAVRPQMHEVDDALFEQLKAGYRLGIPGRLSSEDIEAIGRVWEIITDQDKTVQASTSVTPTREIFWPYVEPAPGLVNHGG